MKYPYLFPAVLLLAMASCEKDSDKGETPTETKTDILSKQIWLYESSGLDPDKNGTIDSPLPAGTIKACTIDNNLSFSSNGQGTMNEGPTKCNNTDPQTLPIKWGFASNEANLDITGTGETGLSGRFKILKLNSTQLSITKDSTNSSGTYTFIVNFKH